MSNCEEIKADHEQHITLLTQVFFFSLQQTHHSSIMYDYRASPQRFLFNGQLCRREEKQKMERAGGKHFVRYYWQIRQTFKLCRWSMCKVLPSVMGNLVFITILPKTLLTLTVSLLWAWYIASNQYEHTFSTVCGLWLRAHRTVLVLLSCKYKI